MQFSSRGGVAVARDFAQISSINVKPAADGVVPSSIVLTSPSQGEGNRRSGGEVEPPSIVVHYIRFIISL